MYKNKFFGCAAILAAAALLQGCSLDEPFGDGGNGELTISTTMNGDVKTTRGVPANNDYLRQNCVVFIENSRGVMRKYKGLDNIPAKITLSTGSYVCNAWSGDSLPASYEAKFYRGKAAFDIEQNQTTSLALKCNIANVVASVDPASLNIGLKNMKVNFSTSRGALDFDETNIPTAKGYFMTPSPEVKAKDEAAYADNTKLTVKITGTKEDGSAYEKTQVVPDVKRAHEYVVVVTKEDRPVIEGGALIEIVIKDIPIIEDTVEVFPGPSVAGVGYDITDQQVNLTHSFGDKKVYIRGYYGLSTVTMSLSENFTDLTSGQNILTASVAEALNAKGILVERHESVDAETNVKVDELYITFKAAYLNGLADSQDPYIVTFECVDERHLTGSGQINFANTEEAIAHIDDAISEPTPDPSIYPMAILGSEATLSARLYKSDAATYGFKYRKAGDSDWLTATATPSSGKPRTRALDYTLYSVTLKGLTPATTYEYKAFVDDFVSETIQTFKTETPFIIPNSSMEDWSTYRASTLLGTKTVVFPGTGSEPTFWDSGNEGAATANKVLTDKSTDMVHSGTYSARLESKLAAGMVAAGNLFFGDYVKTDGTNGVLALGRPYNGTHPVKLRVWMNYRPGNNTKVKSGNESYVDFGAGETDHGQIYVALTDGVVDIRTNPSNRKLFNPEDAQVLAYNQITWTGNYGPDGQLQEVEIPFIYNDRAKSKRPTHLVIVCCASKFGDFFSGSEGSVMYLDDFELIYE